MNLPATAQIGIDRAWEQALSDAGLFDFAGKISLQIKRDSLEIRQEDHLIGTYGLPCRLGEVMEALIRHHRHEERRADMTPVPMGKWILDPVNLSFQTIENKKKIILTEKERDILLILHKNKGTGLGRLDLLHAVWGYGEAIETHTVETHIYRLRQKIEDDPSRPSFLITDESGYRLVL